MAEGWIKLHRKLRKSAMWKALDNNARDVLIILLLKATHRPYQVEVGSRLRTLQPGQIMTSIASLGDECNLTPKQVRTALAKLEKWEFSTRAGAKVGSVITLVNWAQYQGGDEEKGKRGANVGQTSDLEKGQNGAKTRANAESPVATENRGSNVGGDGDRGKDKGKRGANAESEVSEKRATNKKNKNKELQEREERRVFSSEVEDLYTLAVECLADAGHPVPDTDSKEM